MRFDESHGPGLASVNSEAKGYVATRYFGSVIFPSFLDLRLWLSFAQALGSTNGLSAERFTGGGHNLMLQIVVPMAGAGSRFARAGYKDPKDGLRRFLAGPAAALVGAAA